MSTKASSHFIDSGIENGKRQMTCKYCKKKLINSGNSNCMVSHLKSCRPDIRVNS